MQKSFLLILFCFSLFLIASCSGNEATPDNKAAPAEKTNVVEEKSSKSKSTPNATKQKPEKKKIDPVTPEKTKPLDLEETETTSPLIKKMLHGQEIIFLPELEEEQQPTEEEILEDLAILQEFVRTAATLSQVSEENLKEFEDFLTRSKKIDKKKQDLIDETRKQILTKEDQDLLEKNKKIKKIVDETDEVKKLRKRLSEETDLTPEQIDRLADYKNIETKIVDAKDSDEVKRILEEETDLTPEQIEKLIEKKEDIIEDEQNLKVDALRTIYARLIRDRQLNIETVFCEPLYPLDHFVYSPIYYPFDVYEINALAPKAGENLFEEASAIEDTLLEYPDMLTQIEGNADERGTNAYNKALGDRRWYGTYEVFLSMLFEKENLRGISKGEECPFDMKVKKSSGQDETWAGNRRTDIIFKLR